MGVNIEVVSCGVAEAREGRFSRLVLDLVGAGEGARPRAVQLATCRGFPHVTATHCPQLAFPKVEWPGGPCGNVVVLGKPPLEEWPLRENPEGCRMPWARLAKMSLGLGCSMAFCSAKTLKG